MNKPNKNQLAAAKEVFASNPDLETVFVCSDLQCFANEDSAINHEKDVLEKYPNADQMPVKVSRNEPSEKLAPAADIIAAIMSAETAEEVEIIVGTDVRKTVLEAKEAKLNELAGE